MHNLKGTANVVYINGWTQGTIYTGTHVNEPKKAYSELFDSTSDTQVYFDDSIYKIYNDCGYMNGYRLSSSGVTKAHDYSTVTGYISAVGGDIIRIGGIPWHNNAEINYLCAYDSSFNYIGGIYGISGKYYTTQIHSAYEVSDELSTITLADLSDIAYIRVSCHNTQVPDGANMIVTVNEEIV